MFKLFPYGPLAAARGAGGVFIATLYGLQRHAWFGRKLYLYWIVRQDLAASDDDGHDPSPTDEAAVRGAPEHGGHEPGLEVVQL